MKQEKIKTGSVIIKTDGAQPMGNNGYHNNGKRSKFCIGFPLRVVIMKCRLDMALCLILLLAFMAGNLCAETESEKEAAQKELQQLKKPVLFDFWIPKKILPKPKKQWN